MGVTHSAAWPKTKRGKKADLNPACFEGNYSKASKLRSQYLTRNSKKVKK